MSEGHDPARVTTSGWARRHAFTLVVTGLALAWIVLGAVVVEIDDVYDVVGIVAVPAVFWTILMQVRLRAWGRSVGTSLGRRAADTRAEREGRAPRQG